MANISSTEKQHHYGWILIANLVFAWCLAFGFAYDDYLQILNNPRITGATFSWASFSSLFTQSTPGALYRPVTLVTYWATYLIFGSSPIVFHAQNIALHVACCLLVYELVLAVGFKRDLAISSAMLFSAHPIHVEAVANVIGRAELLSCALGLLALLFIILAAKEVQGNRLWLMSSVVAYLLAVLCKESAYSIILLIPLVLLLCGEGQSFKIAGRRLLGLFWPFVLVTVALLLARYGVLGESFAGRGPRPNQVFWENPIFYLATADRVTSALKIAGDYLRLLAFPIHLSADYSRMPEDLLREVYSSDGFLSLSAVATLLVAIALLCYRRSKLALFALWVPVTFITTSNLFHLAPTIMGERLAYMPSVGFSVLVAALIEKLRPKLAFTALAILFTAYSIRAAIRLPVWSSQESLMRQTLADAPASPKAVYNYAVFLLDEKHAPKEAQPYFLRVLQFNPRHVLSMMCLADIAMEGRNFDEMSQWYRQILSIDPSQRKIRDELDRYERFLAARKVPH